MCKQIKKEMREQARLARGLSNAIGYNVDYVYTDVENFDLICLDESLQDAKDMVQKLTEVILELEYLAHVAAREM